MSVAITGSVAIDNIMVFEDRFRNHILPDKIHILNVSFFVPTLDQRWGGTAANIAYNLRLLEEDPIIVATAGRDFQRYAEWLDECGIRRDGIKVLPDTVTAQAYITTDLDDNQITAFHPGAMARATEAPLDRGRFGYRLGVVAANDKQAMIDHATSLRRDGVPFVVDPGQGMPLFSGDELVALLDGAAVYVVNDYEWGLTLENTGLSEEDLAARVGAVVVTLGEKGATVIRGGIDAGVRVRDARTDVPAVRAARIVDPTGCGDSFRAGLLYALLHDLDLEVGAEIGSLFGALKIAEPGPQSIQISLQAFRARFEAEFGHGF